MDIVVVRTFFMWCTILNVALLIITAAVLTFGGDFVYRMHGRWYPMQRETFNAVMYMFVGLFKIVVIVFNLVPYLALTIMG